MSTLENMNESCVNCGVSLESGQIGQCDDCQDQVRITPKVVVLCHNSEGAPEFHTCAPRVTRQEYDAGVHYALAKENAADNGYAEPMIAFDASDSAAHQLGDVLAWL